MKKLTTALPCAKTDAMMSPEKKKEGRAHMEIKEEALTEPLIGELIALSRDWAAENSCRGYRENERADIEGRRVFTVREEGVLIAYLFGQLAREEKGNSVLEKGADYFELEELYVAPAFRSQGVGRALFAKAEHALRAEASAILLATATRDWRRILHFYLDELGMDFWSARLFKTIQG